MTRGRIVLNPKAGSAATAGEQVEALAEATGWEVAQTEGPGDGCRLAREAAEAGVELVTAAGGDGTVSEVVRGLMELDGQPPTLAVLPLGTGNDLARTLGMPLSPADAVAWLAGGEAPTLRADVIEVRAGDRRLWALNSVNGGVADVIREQLDAERKARWGPLAFPIAALDALGELRSHPVSLTLDGETELAFGATFAVLAANGSTVGGGLEVAPGARLDSGCLEVLIVEGENLAQLLAVAMRTKIADPYESDLVVHHRCRRLSIRVPEGFGFTVDGEPLEAQTLELLLHPAALPCLVGPESSRDAS